MHANRKRGSGLFTVLIISTAIGIGVYSTISLVTGEFRLNQKASAYHEAKQAAESLLQVAMADLRTRAENQISFEENLLAPYKDPLHIPQEFVDRFSGTDSGGYLVIPDKTDDSSESDFGDRPTEIIGGKIMAGEWKFIDPGIPGNEFDPLTGTRVLERSIELVSKATVERPNIGSTTVHARQFMLVRDAPLFAYAVFYNLPLEIAPGARMEIHGNIHANADGYFQTSARLDIHSKVTLSGKLFHGRHPDYETEKNVKYGDVRIMNGSGKLVNMKKDDTWPSASANAFNGTWLTGESSDFATISSQIWDGNVETQDHGVGTQNPVGVSDYIEDTNPDTDKKESYNSAYSMIQPVLSESELTIPEPTADNQEKVAIASRKNEVENQKFSYKAGLTISVDPSSGVLSYYTFEKNDGDLLYKSDGTPKVIELEPPTTFASYNVFKEEKDEEGVTKVAAGIHDKRQNEDLDTVELDLAILKDLLHKDEPDDWGNKAEQNPKKWWNGIVYVEFPTENSTSDRPDLVNPATGGATLLVKNGSTIPNPEFKYNHATDPVQGMSLATNQTMYVQGHYNADGDLDTGSPALPDDPDNFGKQGHEAPAALIADSITFLSDNWNPANSTMSSLDDRPAEDTEVSAAILTGLVPSGEDGSRSYSGGLENFPRFLERWSGKSFQVRGSIVALFESEVGTKGWGSGHVYKPPKRDWGFHSKFAEGFLPPGTPNTRRYASVDFQLITQAEFDTHVERIKDAF